MQLELEPVCDKQYMLRMTSVVRTIATLVLFYLLNFVITCHTSGVDPGDMFKMRDDNSVFDGISPSKLNSLWSSSEANWSIKDDNTCSMGTGIVLKRIVRKLFNHIDDLQPSELDDEFIYQSTITYDDYLVMLRHLQGEELNCASLLGLDTLLSKFITNAQIRRPNQMNLFSSLFNLDSPTEFPMTPLENLKQLPFAPLILVLSVLFIIMRMLSNVGYSQIGACTVGTVTIGFIQYYMQRESASIHNHEEKHLRCAKPSVFAKLLGGIGIDYNDCKSLGTSEADKSHLFRTNLAVTVVEFLSELVLQPSVKLWAKIGEGSQSYLNAFSGLSWWLAPIFLLVIYTFIAWAIVKVSTCVLGCWLTKKSSTRPSKVGKSASRYAVDGDSSRRAITDKRRNGYVVKKKK